jgi:hypothetical protein
LGSPHVRRRAGAVVRPLDAAGLAELLGATVFLLEVIRDDG